MTALAVYPFHKAWMIWSPGPQQTTFKALADVPSRTSNSTKSTPLHWLNRKQRGNMTGRGGRGNGRASHVGQRSSFNTNRLASRLAGTCRKARANSAGCGCSTVRCCRRTSRFSRCDSARAVSVSSSSTSSGSKCLGLNISSSSGGSTVAQARSCGPQSSNKSRRGWIDFGFKATVRPQTNSVLDSWWPALEATHHRRMTDSCSGCVAVGTCHTLRLSFELADSTSVCTA